ncbi:TPA: ogr/Delta-like zinc finger family protein [Salmonella enterica subsp. diarizonae]|nr:ogr/Delta-like zinc finger family protein [Salmonella enterica subsp. enterica serovar Enteritidis]EIZ2108653.1 ogr/Delta-like zinc finger family protein [Salmonella enterica]HAU2958930.1 ogr/Delta-like zinc finger family protein [Salmonella enterica subsp. diarizonae]
MFRCPFCGSSARIRTSLALTKENTVRRKYYQCNNLECGLCFSTLEAFEKLTSKHTPKEKLLPGFFSPLPVNSKLL